LSVGSCFSLGLSTVISFCLLLAVGAPASSGPLSDDTSRLHAVTCLVGSSVPAASLGRIGIRNLAPLFGITQVLRGVRRRPFRLTVLRSPDAAGTFTAGMSQVYTTEGVFMNYAHGWALATPGSKVVYNVAVTAMSVTVALGIGTIELLGFLASSFGGSARDGLRLRG
jgi:nickel/cobalt transporter (NiCoT) family protein